MLIWLFLGGLIFSQFPKRRESIWGKNEIRWEPVFAIAFVFPYIIWATFRKGGADTGMYKSIFLATSDNLRDIPALFFSDAKDPGFTAVTIIFKSIFGNQTSLFFFLIAAFQILCIAYVFRKYSSSYWISIFLFIASTDYISWTWNGVRQFIAVAMIFLCFEWLLDKKYMRLIVVILLASLIHGSALLMIPIIFIVQGRAWNKKTIFMLLITMLVITFIDNFTPILNDLLQETQYEGVMTNEIWTVDDGANIVRVLVYSVPAILSLVGLNYVKAANDHVINICVNCSIVTMVLYLVASVTSGIYVGRLPIYTTLYGYISLPWLIENIFTSASARIIKMIMCILFVGFFYYQVFMVWG